MSLTVTRLDSIEAANRNQWNEVVEQADLGCVYHRHEWLRALEAATSAEPRHLLVSKKGNPIAVCPNFVTELGPLRQLSSLRPGYGGPIAVTDEERSLELLLDALPQLCDGRILFNEFRTYDLGYVRYHELLRQRGYAVAIRSARFTLDLTGGWDPLFDAMDGERRRGLRRGREQSFEVIDEELTPRALLRFHDEYATVMERVGFPAQPRSFLLELAAFDDRVKLFSLRVDGDRRGSYLYLLDDEQSTLQHLYTGVTEDDFQYHAAELLHEHAIRWGIEEGYETYELRGSVPDFRNGVFQFKEYFGATATPLLTWERGHPDPALWGLNAGRAAVKRYDLGRSSLSSARTKLSSLLPAEGG